MKEFSAPGYLLWAREDGGQWTKEDMLTKLSSVFFPAKSHVLGASTRVTQDLRQVFLLNRMLDRRLQTPWHDRHGVSYLLRYLANLRKL